jgi:hypothetical protein
MSEYYKYQGAETQKKYQAPETQIDWGAIGKEMSDSIVAERNRREEKKEGLAESQREGLKTITDTPTGELTYMNNVVAEDSENTAAILKLRYDQMTRGLITVKEYTAFKQTLLDSTKLLYGVAKKYQETYGDKMQRLDSNESQYLEAWEMEQVEGIAKLKNYRIVKNPKTGEGFFVKMEVADKDWAEISKDPNNIMSAQQAMTMVSQKRDRFDLQKYSSDATKSLGAVEEQIVIEASAEGGLSKLIRTVDAKKGDYTLKGETVKTYKNWEDKQINTIMSNPFNTTSILTNINMNTEGGEKYTFTYNRSEFDNDKSGKLIYMDRDKVSTGEPVFKPEQVDDVKETIRVFLRSTIDEKYIQTAGSRKQYARTETKTKPNQPSFEKVYKESEAGKINNANTISQLNVDIKDVPGLTEYKIFEAGDGDSKKISILDKKNNIIHIENGGKGISDAQMLEGVKKVLLGLGYQNTAKSWALNKQEEYIRDRTPASDSSGGGAVKSQTGKSGGGFAKHNKK